MFLRRQGCAEALRWRDSSAAVAETEGAGSVAASAAIASWNSRSSRSSSSSSINCLLERPLFPLSRFEKRAFLAVLL